VAPETLFEMKPTNQIENLTSNLLELEVAFFGGKRFWIFTWVLEKFRKPTRWWRFYENCYLTHQTI
jgi:hypothetical protein